jgi:hypothetical protein
MKFSELKTLRNRQGKIYVPEMVLESSVRDEDGTFNFIVNKLRMIITKADFLFNSKQLELIGYSPEFDELDEDEEMIKYDLLLKLTIQNDETEDSEDKKYLLNEINLYNRKTKVTKNLFTYTKN